MTNDERFLTVLRITPYDTDEAKYYAAGLEPETGADIERDIASLLCQGCVTSSERLSDAHARIDQMKRRYDNVTMALAVAGLAISVLLGFLIGRAH